MNRIMALAFSTLTFCSFSSLNYAAPAVQPTGAPVQQIQEISGQLQGQLKQLQAQQEQQIQKLNAQFQAQLKQMQMTLQAQIQKVNTQTQGQMQQLQNGLQQQIKQLQQEMMQFKK